MMLELHNVVIRPHIGPLSLTVGDGQMCCLAGPPQSGKTALLRAVVGLRAIDGGHISIDGELLTPRSAPYFRRLMAYVPQHLAAPDDYPLPTDYLSLLERAVMTGKPLIIADEPPRPLTDREAETVDNMLRDARQRGRTLLVVNSRIGENPVSL